MEEINCPFCGKPNPFENTLCDYCLANLHPPAGESGDPGTHSDAGLWENRAGLGQPEGDSEASDWLRALKQPDQEETIETGEQDSGLGQPSDAISDWITGEYRGEETEFDEVPASPFLSGREEDESPEIPPWLESALDGASEELGEVHDQDLPAFGDESGIPPEIVPGTQTSGESSRDSERAGPLSGLRGVLSAEAGAARIRKSKAYTTNLRLSSSQRAHIELLNNLIQEEGESLPIPQRRSISQQHVLRWGIAILLLIGVFWPIVISRQEMPLPFYDEGSAEVYRLISELPENSQILVGFDYQPGVVTELDSAATPVFNHLLTQGALLTLISTSPNGPVLAERFIRSFESGQGTSPGFDYVNLGYLPGGAAGLVSFIENPQGTIPFTIEGSSAWESTSSNSLSATAGIVEIRDFAMIVLLADDPDMVRTWIEQFGPTITNSQVLTSLIAITSAQLEPIVRPYYESDPQPLNGLVVGLRGGAAYAQFSDESDFPRAVWDAFSVGTFIAALMILIGGLVYYVIPELSRTARGEEKVL